MRSLRNAGILLVLLIGIFAGWQYFADTETLRLPEDLEQTQEVSQPKTPSDTVSAPPPLRGDLQEEEPSTLTVAGVVAETNRHRKVAGLPPLSLNTKLTSAATIKADDMLARQYFAHVSPTGEDVADLANQVGYQYLNLGENLAVGNYESDTVLVQAWMDSPGHRENILGDSFTEIGVAVVRGVYEGHSTWMAVQEFGRPQSVCPAPSEELADEIEANKTRLAELEVELAQKREELDRTSKRSRAYRSKVDEYNELVDTYNTLLEETKILIAEYNEKIEEYNRCLN